MTDGGAFGPTGERAGDAAPFAVIGPAELRLDASRTGRASFTVSNETGRSVRTRLFAQPGAGGDASWFRIDGESERTLDASAKTTIDVTVAVPGDAPAGAASFTLGAALEEAPDRVVSSPPVRFDVPPPGGRRFPWWIVIVAVVAVLLLAGGGILIWSLTRPDAPEPTPTSTPTPTATPTDDAFLRDDFVVDSSSKQVDLDQDTVPDIQVDDADLSPAVPAERPTTVYGLAQGVAIVIEPTPEECRSVVLESSVQIPHADTGVFVCVVTSDGHSGILEFGATRDDQTRDVFVTLWR